MTAMTAIRKLYRTTLLGLWLFIGVILTFIFLRNTIPTSGFVSRLVRGWLGILAYSLGVRIKSYGNRLKENTLFVSNHISWLDILILGSLAPIHFLSKHEVKTMQYSDG